MKLSKGEEGHCHLAVKFWGAGPSVGKCIAVTDGSLWMIDAILFVLLGMPHYIICHNQRRLGRDCRLRWCQINHMLEKFWRRVRQFFYWRSQWRNNCASSLPTGIHSLDLGFLFSLMLLSSFSLAPLLPLSFAGSAWILIREISCLYIHIVITQSYHSEVIYFHLVKEWIAPENE